MEQERTLTESHQEMVDRARSVPGVLEVLRVFEAAMARAPLPRPLQPVVRFSTGANS